MSDQNSNCPCPDEFTMLPIQGIGLAVKTSSLPGGSGVEPGPDNTHLVSRGGALAWDPIAPGGDGVNYSYEEQWTGKLWVDGKKVYQKVVFLDGLPNKAVRYYPHDITNLEHVVSLSGIFIEAPNSFGVLPRSALSNYNIMLRANTDSIGISTYSTADNYAQAKAYVTIQYTCTDR